eukprot:scaffold66575_cov31-Tisochrysis_lutea.AAC.4
MTGGVGASVGAKAARAEEVATKNLKRNDGASAERYSGCPPGASAKAMHACGAGIVRKRAFEVKRAEGVFVGAQCGMGPRCAGTGGFIHFR